jgi:hypothetical protein
MANGRVSAKGAVTQKLALNDFKKGFEIAAKAMTPLKLL